MKIVMTLLVRDEQDIIRENIDFHRSQGVDYFIVTDNKSEDLTTRYLKEYEEKGILSYIFEGDDTYNQHAWVTRMARIAHTRHGADWVINNDADELWWPTNGNLKDTFNQVPPEYNIVLANRHNFVAVENATSHFYSSMIYREKFSLNSFGQPLLPKAAHRGCETVIVHQGNHRVEGIIHPKMIDGLIEIFHFPIRSYSQFENKIAKGGAAYENNQELARNIGGTWRKLYEEYQQNNNLLSYYQESLYDQKKLQEQLESGSILIDKRLSKYFTEKGLT